MNTQLVNSCMQVQALKMTRPGFAAVKSTSTGRFLLILADLGIIRIASLSPLQTRLVIPDIDHLILCLVAHRHRHNIQPTGHYLAATISTRPTNGLFA